MFLPISFLSIILLSFLLLYIGLGKDKRVLFISIFWILLVSVIAASGFLQQFDTKPPRFLLVMIPSLLMAIYFIIIAKSTSLNINALLAIHLIRIPVELVLYALFQEKKVPQIMTFEGWNYDILMGISALLILLYTTILKREIKKSVLLIWNIIGLIFLSIIVCIALLSAPFSFQVFALGNPNLAVFEFPYTLLPCYIVMTVYISHICTIKSLLQKKIKE